MFIKKFKITKATSKENLPLILIHKGNDEYVQIAINQAKFFGNDVIVISDNQFKNCKNYQLKNYDKSSNKFKKHYTHLSTNSYDYELFCFERWFILYEFMYKESIDKIFYIDSDVMLYTNISLDFELFKNYIIAITHKSSPNNSYFTFYGIKKFIEFIMSVYSNTKGELFDKIASNFYINQKHNLPGGVCDMIFFYTFALSNIASAVGEMTYVVDDSAYDHNINSDNTFYKFKNIKKFRFKNGIPYCYNSFLKKNIRFKSIHFQGGSKNLMKKYSTYK